MLSYSSYFIKRVSYYYTMDTEGKYHRHFHFTISQSHFLTLCSRSSIKRSVGVDTWVITSCSITQEQPLKFCTETFFPLNQ